MKNNKEPLLDAIAKYIVNVNNVGLIKETILYLLLADRLHSFVVAPPAAGSKSQLKFFIEKVATGFEYIPAGGWTTSVGIGEALIRMEKGIAFFDEIHRGKKEQKNLLYDLLQFQMVKVTKHSQGFDDIPAGEYKVKANVFATANPMGFNDKWSKFGNISIMKSQINLDSSMFRRFHIIICLDDYSPNEFDRVNRQKEDEIKFDEKEITMLRKFIDKARSITPKYTVPNYIYVFLKNLKLFDNYMLNPVTNELKSGIVEIAKARARIDFSPNVTDEHWRDVLNYYLKTLKTTGLSEETVGKYLLNKVSIPKYY